MWEWHGYYDTICDEFTVWRASTCFRLTDCLGLRVTAPAARSRMAACLGRNITILRPVKTGLKLHLYSIYRYAQTTYSRQQCGLWTTSFYTSFDARDYGEYVTLRHVTCKFLMRPWHWSNELWIRNYTLTILHVMFAMWLSSWYRLAQVKEVGQDRVYMASPNFGVSAMEELLRAYTSHVDKHNVNISLHPPAVYRGEGCKRCTSSAFDRITQWPNRISRTIWCG